MPSGPIADRTREHLGTSDMAVVAMRRTLMDAADQCAASGQPHVAAGRPWLYGVRATQAVLPQGVEPDTAEEVIRSARPRQADAVR